MLCRLKRIGPWVLAVGLSLSLGLHWLALQSVAWTSMVMERSQTVSLSEAVRTTFDGQHPCRICRFIQEGQRSDPQAERSSFPGKPVKLEAPPATSLQPRLSVPAPMCQKVSDPLFRPSRSAPPLLPPPRRA